MERECQKDEERPEREAVTEISGDGRRSEGRGQKSEKRLTSIKYPASSIKYPASSIPATHQTGLLYPQPLVLQAKTGPEFFLCLMLKTLVPHSGQMSSNGSSQVANLHFGYWLQA